MNYRSTLLSKKRENELQEKYDKYKDIPCALCGNGNITSYDDQPTLNDILDLVVLKWVGKLKSDKI